MRISTSFPFCQLTNPIKSAKIQPSMSEQLSPEELKAQIEELLRKKAQEYKERFGSEQPINNLFASDQKYREVIENIIQCLSQLPLRVIVDWYISPPHATKEILFPYLRIDGVLINITDLMDLINNSLRNDENTQTFLKASEQMARLLVWIKVGYEGIEKLASHHEATKNWTSGPGHRASGKEREEYILTKGVKWINEVIENYCRFREENRHLIDSNTDPFIRYNLEELLSPIEVKN